MRVRNVVMQSWARALAVAAMTLAGTADLTAAEPQSPRLDRAKDYIADERWRPAIAELKAAAADAKEANRDEALFWLAHSHNQAGDSAAAVETIHWLEQEFSNSRWVKPARSLKIEIAQRLRRNDVLLWTAVPQPAPPPPVPPTPGVSPAPTPMPAVTPEPNMPRPTTPRPRRPVTAPQAPAVPTPPPSRVWITYGAHPDLELRIQAMGSLILSDSEEAVKVIPMLRDIALEASNPGSARRALFALTQSKRPEARSTVLEVAKKGTEPVQIEAVRALGRIRGPDVSATLMYVYGAGAEPVKYQVVQSLGQCAETTSLLRIAESEANQPLRDAAIQTLGRTPGGSTYLRVMYDKVAPASKRPIIVGLFNARDVEGLIRIHTRERHVTLRREVLERLRLLGTPLAKQYLEQQDEK
jgi:outer membrane biosynthesis protein TonB